MELIRASTISTLRNSGVESRQLMFPGNSTSKRLTLTRVLVPVGGSNPRHSHASSEQVWIALAGTGTLLLADGRTESFSEGDVVRFEDGDVHGLLNDGAAPFEYIAVTAPPIDFRGAYQADWSAAPEM